MSGLETFLLLQCHLDEIFDGRFEAIGLCQYFSMIPTDSDSFGNFVNILIYILNFCDDRWKSKDGTLGEKNKGHYLIFQAQPYHQQHHHHCHYDQQFNCHFHPYHHNCHHHHWLRPHFPSTICFVEKH